MNDDNIRAEIARLKKSAKDQTDTGIQRMILHRIADLERMLKEKYEPDVH